MLDHLDKHHIILASQSPRRRYLLRQLGIEFTEMSAEVDETFPPGMEPDAVARYLAEKKAAHFENLLQDDRTIVITADTLVIVNGRIIGKPGDYDDAVKMLGELSGRMHRVVTGVTIRSLLKSITFTDWTDVYFKDLTPEEISHYLHHYQPYDKAGSYGIQEWIGYIGITRIEGSYFNVMGMPVQRVYEELSKF